jgi:hypothetical protein
MFPVPAMVFTKRKLNKYKVSFHKLHPLTTFIFRIRLSFHGYPILHGLMQSPTSWRGTAQIVEEMTLGEALGRSTIPRTHHFWGCYKPSI